MSTEGIASKVITLVSTKGSVGKTTLARTLLSQSVGEVRDEPHVTDTTTASSWPRPPQGDQLVPVGHPRFRRQRRLARRLLQSDRPIGWFVSQVWDASADRACGPASRPCTTSVKKPTWCCTWSTRPRTPRMPATSNPR